MSSASCNHLFSVDRFLHTQTNFYKYCNMLNFVQNILILKFSVFGWGVGCSISGCFSPPVLGDPAPPPTLPPPPPPTVPSTQQPQPSDPVPRFRQPGDFYQKYYFNLSFLFLDPNEDFDTFVQNCNKSYISQGRYKSQTNYFSTPTLM